MMRVFAIICLASTASAQAVACQDFHELAIVYQGTCSAANCAHATNGAVFRALCPVTCGTCSAQCQNKPAFVAAVLSGNTCAQAAANPAFATNWFYIIGCAQSSGYCLSPGCTFSVDQAAADYYGSGCSYYTTPSITGPISSCTVPAAAGTHQCDVGDTMDATTPGSTYYYGPYHMHIVRSLCPVSFGVTCPPPPSSPVSATRDPHFKLPHGGRTDIRGENGAIYNLLSAKNLSFAAQFEDADFQWAKRLVHGSKMSHAYWTVRTNDNVTVNVEYAAESAKGGYALLYVGGDKHRVTMGKPYILANLNVTLAGRKLFVETGKWRMIAAANAFPFAELNKNKLLLDIEVTPLYDADKDPVAPHGIFGQAYDDDDLAVHGMIDHAQAGVMTTKAQGEGAIEGVLADYKIPSPFDTAFKYSRFDVLSAPHRNVSKLTGAKVPRVNVPRSMAHAAANHDEVEA